MEQRERSLFVSTLVYIGAVILIGLPATALVGSGFEMLLGVLEVESAVFESAWGLVVLLVSLLIGLQLAVEAAALQLGGVEALDRGSRRTARLRSVVLTLGVFCVLAGSIWIGLSAVLAESGPPTTAIGTLVGLAALVVLYRGASAFLTGYRNDA